MPYKPRKKLTPQEAKLARNIWLNNNKKRFTCPLCNYGSCNNSNLLVHYRRKKHIKNVKLQKEKIANLMKRLEKIDQ